MASDLQREVRNLWKKCNPLMEDEALDIYFSETYSPTQLVTEKKGDTLVACAQWLERKMTFTAIPVSIGIITGIKVDPELKAAERDRFLSRIFTTIHQRMAERGLMYSLVVPQDAKLREWMASRGYNNATSVLAAETTIPAAFVADPNLEVKEEMEWGRDLWLFYAQNGGQHDFELRLTEDDFYAMIERHDLAGGAVLVARRRGHIVGFALAAREGKPLKSGKSSDKTFRANLRFVLTTEDHALFCFEQKALDIYPDCKTIVVSGGCPAKGFKTARPHAMVRTISAEKFLTFIAQHLPGLQLTIGVAGDEDIPANNKGYRLRSGRCYISEELPDSVVGPGGIPAMLLAGQLVLVPEI